MTKRQVRLSRKQRRRRQRRRQLHDAAHKFIRAVKNFLQRTPKTEAAILITFITIYVAVMLGFAIGGMISTKGKTSTEQESEAEEQTESDLNADEEYPFNTMSQDWSGEDMEGFCYHEISDECKAAGGKFPVMAQIYTYIVCQNYGVDYEMVFALIEQESECNWNASGDGGTSWGYMQIAQKWHKERMQRLNCTDLTNPYQNVTVGIDYLKEIQDSLQEVPEDVRPYYVLAVYNYGAAGAKENLWNHGVYKYSYNTAIMERAAQLKAEKERQDTKEE